MKLLYYSLLLIVVLALVFQVSEAKCVHRRQCKRVYNGRNRSWVVMCRKLHFCTTRWSIVRRVHRG
ncbi:Uncharacterised protein r2_g1363 [Pycnogonum litorale]